MSVTASTVLASTAALEGGVVASTDQAGVTLAGTVASHSSAGSGGVASLSGASWVVATDTNAGTASATDLGGCVVVWDRGNATLSGGSLAKCSAHAGGAVAVIGAEAAVSAAGVAIKGNVAASAGGGVLLWEPTSSFWAR